MSRSSTRMYRRQMLLAAGALGVAHSLSHTKNSWAAPVKKANSESALSELSKWIAHPPLGFSPFVAPGVVAKANAKGDFPSLMQKNQLWPKAELARRLVERSLTDLTGASNIVTAMGRFVHPADTVAIKVNGIAGQVGHTMAVNFEVILPVVEAVLALGVPPSRLFVYEQYPTYLRGCRVNVRKWQLPEGVVVGTHNNRDHVMPRIQIFEKVRTRYCRFFTEASCVIDMTMMKDHSICGFTGALKNITHGNIDNPEDHHAHQASPQIALLYNHPIVQSRVRLHIVDAFKIIYDKGPLDKDPRKRVPHGSVYASTDPVALDTIGTRVIEAERKERGGMTLLAAGREPRYLRRAAELGIGVHDLNDIRLRSAVI